VEVQVQADAGAEPKEEIQADEPQCATPDGTIDPSVQRKIV